MGIFRKLIRFCLGLIFLFGGVSIKNSQSQELSWTMYDYNNTPLDGYFGGIVEDHFGNKWIATSNGLFKWNGDDWTHYNSENSGLPHDVMHCIVIDENDIMWIGTGYGGLTRFDGQNWYSYDYGNSNIPYTEINDIAINSNSGDIWICMYGYGIAKFDGNNFTHYITPDSPWEEDLNYDIGIENDTTVWVTTIGAGLARLSGNEWTVFDTTNSELTASSTLYIAIDYNNNKYVTTNNGLFIIDQYGEQTMLDTGYFTNSQRAIWGIIETMDSSIWIGGHNLIKYKNGEWQSIPLNQVQPYGSLENLYEDHDGNLWSWMLSKLYYLEINTVVTQNYNFIQISAYPNPFNDIIKFYSSENENIESISLYDMSGRLIFYKNNTQRDTDLEINGFLLNSGCYIACLQISESKERIYIKITKN
ncbi:MAG TPA: T9SS type A sorting domain-containing protein [Bacteroidales bacterium]|nr:T9SS type A sorting domain-containing protein [Bacteroidales bacterium]